MPADSKVSIFTTTMRSEFAAAYHAVAEPAEFKRYTTVIPSTARIEHYHWMSPAPGMSRYAGHRRFGKIDTVRYSVENVEFDSAFQVLLRDIEDDQTGGYKIKPRELAQRAKVFPSRWVLKHLAAAKSRPCFDGSNFVADSHTIGTGDNLIAFDGGSNDGLTYKLCALYHGGQLNPLIWQTRKGPKFMTDGGSPESSKVKMVNYWIDLEGEAAYGYWWDAVWVDITDTPTIAEMHDILGRITHRFRGFQLPKALNSDDGEYIHEQSRFNASNLTLVGSTGLENLLRQVLNQEWIPQAGAGGSSGMVATTNLWKGAADYVVSAFMD